MENGDYLLLGQDHGENIREIARHSKHDADAYDAFDHDIDRGLQVIKPLLDQVPPDIFSNDPEELIALARARLALPRSRAEGAPRRRPPADRLAPPTSSTTTSSPTSSRATSPRRASSGRRSGRTRRAPGLVLLYHFIGEHDGDFGAWAFHKKGNGGFTQVLARAAAVVRRGDRARVAGRPRHHEERPGDRGRPHRRHASTTPTSSSRRSTRGGRSSSSSTRASCRPISSTTSAASASRARRRRSTSRSTGCRHTRPSATAATSTAASRTSGRRWSTSSTPSTTRSTAGTASARISTGDPVDDRPGHGAARQARHELLHPVHAVQAPRERLGHGEGEPRRHRPARRSSRSSRASATSSSSARSGRRSTSSGRSACPRATSSPASSSRRRCSSSGRRRAGRSTGRRSTATTSAAPGTHPGGCVMGAPGKLAAGQILKDRSKVKG